MTAADDSVNKWEEQHPSAPALPMCREGARAAPALTSTITSGCWQLGAGSRAYHPEGRAGTHVPLGTMDQCSCTRGLCVP